MIWGLMTYSRRRLLAQVFGCGAVGALMGPITSTRASTMLYEYDALGRLKSVTYPDNSVVAYSYDAAGNRVQKGPPSSSGGGFTATIQIAGPGPVDLRSLANSSGYNGAQDATITFEVANGVTVTGEAGGTGSQSWPGSPGLDGSPGGVGIDTGTWPSSHAISLSLLVKSGGAVRGGGGGGGGGACDAGGGNGGVGGDAVFARVPLSITIAAGGEIAGGGDGGGGGSGQSVWEYGDYYYWFGGEGGGGYPNGSGGGGGSTSGGGAGGSGDHPWYTSGGGNGASAGYSGYAIRKNGHAVSVSNNGTLIGTAA